MPVILGWRFQSLVHLLPFIWIFFLHWSDLRTLVVCYNGKSESNHGCRNIGILEKKYSESICQCMRYWHVENLGDGLFWKKRDICSYSDHIVDQCCGSQHWILNLDT